jgi:Tfp pilus assembly protein PilF
LQHAPNNIDLHSRLADIAQLKGQIDIAISEYETILKLDPGSIVAANNLASLLSDYRTDQASLDRAYQVALMLNKTPVPSFQDTLGWVYYLRGDKKAAMKLLEDAAKALPERAAVQYHLGVAYGADGQAAKAREQFQKALKLNPNKMLEAKIRAAEEKVGL